MKKIINKKNFEDRLKNEKLFHDIRFKKNKIRPKLYRYGLRNWYSEYKNFLLLSEGNLLEVGAGLESCFIEYEDLNNLIEKKLNVISIDISSVAVNKCKIYEKNGLRFIQDDAHYLKKIDDKNIKYFIGRGIIHHLDIKKFITAVKKKSSTNNCKYLFAEPLQSNLFIRLYRFLTPHKRTKDERPLTINDVKFIQNSFKGINHSKYYGFLTIPFSFLGISNYVIEYIDNLILNKFKLGKYLAWSIIITNINANSNL